MLKGDLSVAKLCSEELTDFTKEQKEKLMQFATEDKEFIERCKYVQDEFVSIDDKWIWNKEAGTKLIFWTAKAHYIANTPLENTI